MTLARLKNEISEIKKNPPSYCTLGPIFDNIRHWNATVYGPSDTPYEGKL